MTGLMKLTNAFAINFQAGILPWKGCGGSGPNRSPNKEKPLLSLNDFFVFALLFPVSLFIKKIIY